jgi:OOP family OmpA-OmpF porin
MKHIAKALLAIAALAGALAAAPAAAQLQFGRMDTGLYLGGSVGGTKYRHACDGLPGGVSCDETDVGWRGFVGYQFNHWIGLEFGYADLGKAEASTPGVVASVKARSADLVAVASFPINELFGVYGKLGGARTRVTATAPGFSAKDTSTNFTFGAGARLNFARNWGARLEWQRYHDVGDETTTGKGKIDYFSLGLLYGFY